MIRHPVGLSADDNISLQRTKKERRHPVAEKSLSDGTKLIGTLKQWQATAAVT